MTAQLKPITGMRESVEDLNGEITEYSYLRNRFLGEPIPESFEPEAVLRVESGEPAQIPS